jgi:hypothetical protein
MNNTLISTIGKFIKIYFNEPKSSQNPSIAFIRGPIYIILYKMIKL